MLQRRASQIIISLTIVLLIIMSHCEKDKPQKGTDHVAIVPAPSTNNIFLYKKEDRSYLQDHLLEQSTEAYDNAAVEQSLRMYFTNYYIFEEKYHIPLINYDKNTCIITGEFRRDIDYKSIKTFMENIQSKEYKDYLNRHGFYIKDMVFGTDESNKRDTFLATVEFYNKISK